MFTEQEMKRNLNWSFRQQADSPNMNPFRQELSLFAYIATVSSPQECLIQ